MIEDEDEKINIGIIGCGHIGLTLAKTFIKNNTIISKNLFLSYSGSEDTYQKIVSSGLDSCLSNNEKIAAKCQIIFLCVKPQDIHALSNLTFNSSALIISLLAGVQTKQLKEILNHANVKRGMISAPGPIEKNKGIIVFESPLSLKVVTPLFKLFKGSFIFKTSASEAAMDIVCMLVALPSIISILKPEQTKEFNLAADKLIKEYPDYDDLIFNLVIWAKDVTPKFENDVSKNEYISKMKTKGGITETMQNFINKDEPIYEVLKAGIAKSAEFRL